MFPLLTATRRHLLCWWVVCIVIAQIIWDTHGKSQDRQTAKHYTPTHYADASLPPPATNDPFDAYSAPHYVAYTLDFPPSERPQPSLEYKPYIQNSQMTEKLWKQRKPLKRSLTSTYQRSTTSIREYMHRLLQNHRAFYKTEVFKSKNPTLFKARNRIPSIPPYQRPTAASVANILLSLAPTAWFEPIPGLVPANDTYNKGSTSREVLEATSTTATTKRVQQQKIFFYLLLSFLVNDLGCLLTSSLNLFLSNKHIYIQFPHFLCYTIQLHNTVHQRIRDGLTENKNLQKIFITPILEEMEFRWLIQEICLRYVPSSLFKHYSKYLLDSSSLKQTTKEQMHKPKRFFSNWYPLKYIKGRTKSHASLQISDNNNFLVDRKHIMLIVAKLSRVVLSALVFAIPHHQPLKQTHSSGFGEHTHLMDRNAASVIDCIRANRILTAFGQGLLWGAVQEILHNPLYCILLHTLYNLQQFALIRSLRHYFTSNTSPP